MNTLNLRDQGLEQLPALPEGLQVLHCDFNSLQQLPRLPEGLQVLHCDFNSLKELPPLPSTLKELSCSHNQLSFLPLLPEGLEVLICAKNALKKLPDLPSSLKYINFSYNTVKDVPELPSGLEHIECFGNPIEILPMIPYELPYDGMMFEWKSLKEPFRKWYADSLDLDDEIHPGERMATLRHNVNTWYEEQFRKRARNTGHFLHASGLRNKVGYGTNALIASFLSGQRGSVEQQNDALRFLAGEPARKPLSVPVPVSSTPTGLNGPAAAGSGAKQKGGKPRGRHSKRKQKRGKKHTRHGKRGS